MLHFFLTKFCNKNVQIYSFLAGSWKLGVYVLVEEILYGKRVRSFLLTSWDIPFESGRFQSEGGKYGVFLPPLNQIQHYESFESNSTNIIAGN